VGGEPRQNQAGMTTPEQILKGAWGITALLFLFMVVNFANKIVVGLAAVPIMRELQVPPERFGQLIGSPFFALSTVSALVVCLVASRFETRRVLLALGIVGVLVQLPMMWTVGFGTLVACRFILGVVDGPASPIATDALYKWFPDSRRALPTIVMTLGAGVGIVLESPLNWLVVHYSWHWAFAALAVLNALWLVLWLAFGREGTIAQSTVGSRGGGRGGGGERIPFRYLIFCPSILAACCAGFASFGATALGLTWFTAYLVDGLGYSQEVAGNLSTVPALFSMVVLMAGGIAMDYLQTRGFSTRFTRGLLAAGLVALGGCLLPLMPVTSSATLKLALLIVGTALAAPIFVAVPMVVSELTPQPQRAVMLAIANAIVSISGVFAPMAMGWLVGGSALRQAGYERGFVLLGFLLIVGGLIGALFVRPERDRQWLAKYARPL